MSHSYAKLKTWHFSGLAIIKRYGEIVLWTTLKYVDDRHLNMEYFSPEDKAWFKWYLKHYLDIFYKKSISEKANQLLKS